MGKIFIYDSSHRRVGHQALANRLSVISRKINFPWFNQDLNPHALRIKLKSVFLSTLSLSYLSRRFFPQVEHPTSPPLCNPLPTPLSKILVFLPIEIAQN